MIGPPLCANQRSRCAGIVLPRTPHLTPHFISHIMPRRPQSSQAKCWCFTLNNYEPSDVDTILSFCREHCVYAIVGREVGAEGTPHLQGYLRLRTQSRLNGLKEKCHRGAHFEVARGSWQHNRTYCSKEGNFEEIGDPAGGAEGKKGRDALATEFERSVSTGQRSGLVLFRDANPGVFGFSGHTLLRNFLSVAPVVARASISCKWYHGLPGVGKSRMAHDAHPLAYAKDPLTKWWNGYLLETASIIDDFPSRGAININHLLRWFDRYPCNVEHKGGMLPLHVVSFIVTSNFHPRDCFQNPDGTPHDQLDALIRRVSVTHVLSYSPSGVL